MRMFVYNVDGRLRAADGEDKASQSWQIGHTVGFDEHTESHVFVREHKWFGWFPQAMAPDEYPAAICASNDWHILSPQRGYQKHYRRNRQGTEAEAQALMRVNETNQSEMNREAALRQHEPINERIWTWVTFGLMALLAVQSSAIWIPALVEAWGKLV